MDAVTPSAPRVPEVEMAGSNTPAIAVEEGSTELAKLVDAVTPSALRVPEVETEGGNAPDRGRAPF